MVLELTGARNYQNNVNKRNKTLERLSKGYRINRSADDAAGLAISEKIQIQVSGVEQADNNVKDAISLVQTGEAAMQEIHGMLDRIYALAEQSNNGTYDDEVDRENLQKEVSQLKTEIDRISKSANYNGLPLLSGEMDVSGVSGDEYYSQVTRIHKTASNIMGLASKAAVPAIWTGNLDLDNATDGAYVEINGVQFQFWPHATQHNSTSGSVLVQVLAGASVGAKAQALKNAINAEIKANESNVNSPLYGLDPNVSISSDGKNLTIKQKKDDFKNPVSSGILNNRSIRVSSGNVIQGFTLTGNLVIDNEYNQLDGFNLNHITDGATITLFGKKYTIRVANSGVAWTPVSSDIVISCNSKNNNGRDIKKKDLQKAIEDIVVTTMGVATSVQIGGSYVRGHTVMIEYKASYPASQRMGADVVIQNNPVALSASNISSSNTIQAVKKQKATRKEIIDFSALRQGDSITVDGKRYEFKVDGAASAEQIMNEFMTAFQNDPPDGLAATAERKPPPLKIVFTASAPREGQWIAVSYDTKQEEDEAARRMIIPCNKFIFQIGASVEERLVLSIQNVSVRYLGIDGVDVSAQEKAADSMDRIKQAVDQLSDNRGVLGAVQNRLEHTVNSLGTTGENLTDSLSTIKDADMAKEVMAHTKNQILSESTQSMVAQSENLLRQRVRFFTDL